MGMRVGAATAALVLVAAALAVGLVPSVAHADGARLAQAKAALEELRYDDARAALEGALSAGDNSPEQLREVYKLSAQVAAALGDEAAAQGYFAHLLALSPDFTLPAGTSPKVSGPFDAAKKQLAGKAIHCRYQIDRDGPTVSVSVDADPLGMVAGARANLSSDAGDSEVTSDNGPPYVLPLPEGQRLQVTISVLDAKGNQLIVYGGDTPIEIQTKAANPRGGGKRGGGGRSRPFYASPWLWGGVTLAAAGAGTYFGLDVLSAQDEIEKLNKQSVTMPPVDFSKAKAVEDRGKRSALFANVTFGVAGAAAVVTVICLFRGGGSHDGHAKKSAPADESAWLPMIGPDTAGVVFVTPF